MSNVLIGIIGVILFIGLALAGALFLGPKFQEAGANTKATTIMSILKQTSDAAAMAELTSGKSVMVGEASSLSPEFLKSQTSNPSNIAKSQPENYILKLRLDENIAPNSSDRGGVSPAKYAVAVVGIGDDASTSRPICQKIADQYSNGVIQSDVLQPEGVAGCSFMSGYFYIAWHKI